jgi:hypothetical protein
MINAITISAMMSPKDPFPTPTAWLPAWPPVESTLAAE